MGDTTRLAIQAAFETRDVSTASITFWEVAMLLLKGRIVTSIDTRRWRRELLRGGLREIALDGEIAIASTALVDLHSDPADRIILATALHTGATLVTADRRLLNWPGTLERIDARQ